MISLTNLSFNRTNNLSNHLILDDFSIAIQPTEIVCIMGASGCGKTTLLRLIAGLETPLHGQIMVDGQLLDDAHHHRPAHLRGVGMVFQNHALFPHLTVAKNVAFGIQKKPKEIIRFIVDELLQWVGLPDYHDRYIHELSGGQQQRVALARAMAPQPKGLLLDEPFSSLDSKLRHRLAHETRDMIKQKGITALWVTHDPAEAFAVADRIAVMHQGRLCQIGRYQDLYQQPHSPEVAYLLGDGSEIEAKPIIAHQWQTELGCVTHPTLSSDHPATLFLRPEQVTLLDQPHDDAIPVIVKTCQFMGGYLQYGLQLPSQALILCLAPHTNQHPLGSMRWISRYNGDSAILFSKFTPNQG